MGSFKFNKLIRISIIFIMLLLLSPPTYSFGENDVEHAYTVPVVVKFVNISDDGECFHSDELTYNLDEYNNMVYYTIAKSSDEKIDNISIESDGIYHDFEVTNSQNETTIKAALYYDESKEKKLTNKSVKLIYHYRSINSVDLYNDVAVYNHTPWSDSTSTASKLETYITYPASREDIRIYDNPPYLISSHSWVNNHRYETRYKQIDAKANPKQVVMMPRDAFKSNEYTNNINQDNKDNLIKYQEDYHNAIESNNNLAYSLIALSVLLMIVPLIISFKYFKQSDIGNIDINDLDDDYIKTNMILNDKKNQVNTDAFYATILELINKKYIRVSYIDDRLYLSTGNSTGNLKAHEKLVFDYLSGHITEKITPDRLASSINHDELNRIHDEFIRICSLDYSTDNLFDNKTSKALKYYTIIAGIYAVLAFVLINILNPQVPIFTWLFRCIIVLIPIIILAYLLSVKIKNNWNRQGKVHHEGWKQFEAYLNDYSLIERNPPQSPDTLSEYIVYSASMGVDLSFRQNIIRYINENDESLADKNDLIRLFYHDSNRSLSFVE